MEGSTEVVNFVRNKSTLQHQDIIILRPMVGLVFFINIFNKKQVFINLLFVIDHKECFYFENTIIIWTFINLKLDLYF